MKGRVRGGVEFDGTGEAGGRRQAGRVRVLRKGECVEVGGSIPTFSFLLNFTVYQALFHSTCRWGSGWVKVDRLIGQGGV